MCDNCGPVSEFVVCDANSLGFQGKFVILVFTQKRNIDDVVIQRKSQVYFYYFSCVLFIEKPYIKLTIRVCVIVYHHFYDKFFLI